MDNYNLLMLFAGIYTILFFNLIHNFRQSKKTHALIKNLEAIVSNTSELNRVAKMMKNVGSLESIEEIDKGNVSIKKRSSSDPPVITEEPVSPPAEEETQAGQEGEPPLAKLLKERKEQ